MGEPPKTEPIVGEDTVPEKKEEKKKEEGKGLKKKPKMSYEMCLTNRD